ncbi:MAG: hypothetical protein RMI34_10715, partial [Chloroherpetonaceae bacterium]|nr:hypothetical protein [Chloroherpetonaceae bacterium]
MSFPKTFARYLLRHNERFDKFLPFKHSADLSPENHYQYAFMFELTDTSNLTKTDLYKTLTVQLYHLLEGEHDFIANAANFSALLYHTMPD